MDEEGSQDGQGKGSGDTSLFDRAGDYKKEDGEGEGADDDATEDATGGGRSRKGVGKGADDAGKEGEWCEQATQAWTKEGGAVGED